MLIGYLPCAGAFPSIRVIETDISANSSPSPDVHQQIIFNVVLDKYSVKRYSGNTFKGESRCCLGGF